MSSASQDAQQRYRACVFSVVMIVFIVAPIVQNFREEPDDGFPLSYYPMFTKQRDSTTRLTHPIGIRRDGSEISLHYKFAGGGGMNQVRRQMRRSVRRGKSNSLAKNVARRIAKSNDPAHRGIVEIRIVTDTYNLREFFGNQRRPVNREEHIAFEVKRKSIRTE